MTRISLEITLVTTASEEEIKAKVNEFCTSLAEFDEYLHVDSFDIDEV